MVWTASLPQGLDNLLSRHFAGECKAICPPIEAQHKLGDATGQRTKTQK